MDPAAPGQVSLDQNDIGRVPLGLGQRFPSVRSGGGYLERPAPSGLADVIEIILDKGIVIDAYVRVSLVGIELLTVDARTPADGATGVSTSPTLSVEVSDPDSNPMTVTFFGRPFASGNFAQIAQNTGVASGTNTTTPWANIGAGHGVAELV